jgi:hypothetical protein
MVERVEREPTMDEIVVALREARRGDARGPRLALVGEPDGTRAAGLGATDIGQLRDAEINRLLEENARLNERVMFLLNVIQRDQTEIAALATERTARDQAVGEIVNKVRATLEAALRPVLLALLQGLQSKRRDEPAGPLVRFPEPDAAPDQAGWIVDLDAQPPPHIPEQEARP